MSGRRMGYCVGNDSPGYMNYGFVHNIGRQYRRRGGMRYRFRGWNEFYPEMMHPGVSEETLLENELRLLKDQLASVEKQLEALKKKPE
jgi:hypothetical protein